MTVELEIPEKRKRLEISETFDYFPRTREYNRQYANFYWFRLEYLKPLLLHSFNNTTSTPRNNVKYVDKLFDIKPSEKCFVIGTVFMEMPFKPNVLDDVEHDHDLALTDIPLKYYSTSGQDYAVYIEDSSGRVQISGPILYSSFLVTGIILGIVGMEKEGGLFEIMDIVTPGYAPSLPLPIAQQNDDEKYIAFCSGLEFSAFSDCLSTDVFADFISGRLDNAFVCSVATFTHTD